MDSQRIYSESQACFSRTRAGLIAYRREIGSEHFSKPSGDSKTSPVLSSDLDTIDEALIAMCREA